MIQVNIDNSSTYHFLSFNEYIKKYPNFTGILTDKAGNKRWYKSGGSHREDGPAGEWANGDKGWYLNGKLHREDGPAYEGSDGFKAWFINEERLTEEEYNAWQRSQKLEAFLDEDS